VTRPTPREREAIKALVGLTIRDVTVLGDGSVVIQAGAETSGRRGPAYQLHVMRDPEGNGPGALHVHDIYGGPSAILGGE
jgi:hypothetical protein